MKIDCPTPVGASVKDTAEEHVSVNPNRLSSLRNWVDGSACNATTQTSVSMHPGWTEIRRVGKYVDDRENRLAVIRASEGIVIVAHWYALQVHSNTCKAL